jgi:large subunit ribosomal protein L27
MGKDFTIFSKVEGLVKYERLGKDRKKVSVVPVADSTEAAKA